MLVGGRPIQVRDAVPIGCAEPRSTTIRPDAPGRHPVCGSPSTAYAGELVPGGSGEVGNVVRPSAGSVVGVVAPVRNSIATSALASSTGRYSPLATGTTVN